MGNLDYYLRMMIQADKEGRVTKVQATETVEFTSQLTSGQTRKSIAVYNNSNSASGEAFYGFSSSMSPSGESMVIPVGALVNVPIAVTTNIEFYLCASSGEIADLRVEELA